LEAAGIILRTDLSKTVSHVEYKLTDTMQEPLGVLLDHLAEWGKLYDSIKLRKSPQPATQSNDNMEAHKR
jgi:DNA-binding HxlR family transcriptional regulator